MIAPHPFGYDITPAVLISTFRVATCWEERYRKLIQLARELPALPDALKQQELELTGCEARIWLGHQQLESGCLHFYADGEGRIIRGLLAVLLTGIEGKTPPQLLGSDPLMLFAQSGLHHQLSTSRTMVLQRLARTVVAIATRYQT